MRILISVGYNKLLLGPKAGAEIMVALEGACSVEEKGGWNEPKKYVPKPSEEMSITIINDDSITLPENSNSDFEMFHRLAGERDELKKKCADLEKQLKEVKEAVQS